MKYRKKPKNENYKGIKCCENCGKFAEEYYLVERTHYVCGKCKYKMKLVKKKFK